MFLADHLRPIFLCLLVATGGAFCSAERNNFADPLAANYVPNYQPPENLATNPRSASGRVNNTSVLTWQRAPHPDIQGYYYTIDVVPTLDAPGTFIGEVSLPLSVLSTDATHEIRIHTVFGAMTGRFLIEPAVHATISVAYEAAGDLAGPAFTGFSTNPNPPRSSVLNMFYFNFSRKIDTSTITTGGPFGNVCSGSIQISFDNLTSCIPLNVPDSTNPSNDTQFLTTIAANQVYFQSTQSPFRYRITTAVLDAWGEPLDAVAENSFTVDP